MGAINNTPYDSVVMLTWSDWFTELRSNRYHYATRFSRSVPVLFVQPDLNEKTYRYEPSEIANLTILHVYKKYGTEQSKLLNKALLEKRCLSPLFWIYNIYFYQFIAQHSSVLNVYHGTEDYLASQSHLKFESQSLIDTFNLTLSCCDLLLCVSDGVADSFQNHSSYQGAKYIIDRIDYSHFFYNSI